MDLSQAYRWISPDQSLPPVFTPENVEEARQWLREKDRPQRRVLVAGAGSHWYIGANPQPVTDVLSLRRWDRVTDYSPGDMIVEVEAGCTLGRLEQTLSQEGQFLPFLPFSSPQATIGGVVAAGLESPFSGELGGPRDSIIGVEVLHSDGMLSHAGGKVVKNVAGYDLCKLYCGSLGTLGVLTRLAFKVRPLRGRPATALVGFGTASQLLETARKLRDHAAPAALEILSGKLCRAAPEALSTATWMLAARLADAPGAAAYKRRQIESQAASAVWLEGRDEETFWQDWTQSRRAMLAPDRPQACLLVSTPLSRLGDLLEDLSGTFGGEEGAPAISGSFPRSRLHAFFSERPDSEQRVERLRQRWNRREDSTILWKGSPKLKSKLDVWGLPSPLKKIHNQLQAALDPDRVFNPGRL
ncbi:MAG TPA: FAD-binding oxidoreductase [Acidobacteriota bacterium]|nr:FAD-binding oxidoreductase [Acidobacteriota bacterium]